MEYLGKIFVSKNVFFLLLIMICLSCNDEESLPSSGSGDGILLVPKFLDLPKEASSEEVLFSADTDWRIENNTDTWVTISPMEGNAGNNISLQIHVAENDKPEVRIAKVVVKTLDNIEADTLTIRQFGMTPYVNIDWNEEATLSRFDLSTGAVDISFTGEIPTFVPRISSIVVPTDSLFYIRIVDEVQVKGNQVSLKTTEGNMTNIFMNQEFTLSTIPIEPASLLRSGIISTTDANGIIHPIRISTRTEEGEKIVFYDAENPFSLRNMDIDKNMNFFYYHKSFSGDTLFDKGGVSLLWDKCDFTSRVDGQFHFSFADSIHILNGGIVVPKGELLTFFYLLKGSIDFDMLLHMIAMKKYEGKTKEPISIIKDALGKNGIRVDFLVGNVPVSINVKASILGEASITSEMRGDLIGGLRTGLALSCSVSYYGKDNGFKAEGSVSPSFHLYKPEIKVKGTMDVNASIYPVISVMLYNFAGPTVKVIPTLGDEIRYGGQIGGESETYASWTNRLYTLINATGQLNLNFVGKPFSSPELSLMKEYSKDIYRTPENIEFMEKEVKAQVGKPITVKVKVTDYSALQDEAPVATGAVVKFEPTEGKVNQEFAITGIDGIATIVYTPTSEQSFLKAKIMDADGNEIASDVLKPQFDNSIDIIGTYKSLTYMSNPELVDNVTFYPDGTYKYVFKLPSPYDLEIQHTEIKGVYHIEGEVIFAPGSNDYFTYLVITPNSRTDTYLVVGFDGEYKQLPEDKIVRSPARTVFGAERKYLIHVNSLGKVSKIILHAPEFAGPSGVNGVVVLSRILDPVDIN